MDLDQVAEAAIGMGIQAVEYLELRAEAYRAAGRLDEAVAAYEKLLKVYGGHALSHYALGGLEEMGRPGDAAREYERFLEMWANADEGLPQFIDARERLGRIDQARAQ